MNRSLEKDKENLLNKFNELMSQRGVKSKEEVMKQLFEGEEGFDLGNVGTVKSMSNLRKPRNSTKENKKDKEEDEYNDFQKDENEGKKEDTFFVTNLPKEALQQKEEEAT